LGLLIPSRHHCARLFASRLYRILVQEIDFLQGQVLKLPRGERSNPFELMASALRGVSNMATNEVSFYKGRSASIPERSPATRRCALDAPRGPFEPTKRPIVESTLIARAVSSENVSYGETRTPGAVRSTLTSLWFES